MWRPIDEVLTALLCRGSLMSDRLSQSPLTNTFYQASPLYRHPRSLPPSGRTQCPHLRPKTKESWPPRPIRTSRMRGRDRESERFAGRCHKIGCRWPGNARKGIRMGT